GTFVALSRGCRALTEVAETSHKECPLCWSYRPSGSSNLRLREQRLFGRKTETTAATAPSAPDASDTSTPPQPRGQWRGKPGPKRRDHSHLPAVVSDGANGISKPVRRRGRVSWVAAGIGAFGTSSGSRRRWDSGSSSSPGGGQRRREWYL